MSLPARTIEPARPQIQAHGPQGRDRRQFSSAYSVSVWAETIPRPHRASRWRTCADGRVEERAGTALPPQAETM